HELRGQYEGVHEKHPIDDIPEGAWVAPPVTFKLPNYAGYGSITESALIGYSGMALQADGKRGLRARLGHAHPASYPFVLRFCQDEANRISNPTVNQGTIT